MESIRSYSQALTTLSRLLVTQILEELRLLGLRELDPLSLLLLAIISRSACWSLVEAMRLLSLKMWILNLQPERQWSLVLETQARPARMENALLFTKVCMKE